MFKTQYHKTQAQRIDSFLHEFLKDYSRSYIQRIIEAGYVTKNGTIIRKPKTLVILGDIVEINTIDLKKEQFLTDTSTIDKDIAKRVKIIYEGDQFLVIDKPAGLLVHKTMNPNSYSLVEYLLEQYPEIQGVQSQTVEGQNRSGIVHRIDKDTSGLLIIARTQAAYYELKELFQRRSIKKEYQCLVYGHLKQRTGDITYPIVRSRLDHTKRVAVVSEKQSRNTIRTAHTEYQVIQSYQEYDLLSVILHTGRTHQIRVHMQAIHHPIVGDRMYAGKLLQKYPLNLERQFLHASYLEFSFQGKKYHFSSELPKDLQHLLDNLG